MAGLHSLLLCHGFTKEVMVRMVYFKNVPSKVRAFRFWFNCKPNYFEVLISVHKGQNWDEQCILYQGKILLKGPGNRKRTSAFTSLYKCMHPHDARLQQGRIGPHYLHPPAVRYLRFFSENISGILLADSLLDINWSSKVSEWVINPSSLQTGRDMFRRLVIGQKLMKSHRGRNHYVAMVILCKLLQPPFGGTERYRADSGGKSTCCPFQRTRVLFPAPELGSSQPFITPTPEGLMPLPFAGTHTHTHTPTHCTRTHI